MLYTSRKKTPLFYNGVVKYFFLPLLTAAGGGLSYWLIVAETGISKGAYNTLNGMLRSYLGVSLSHMQDSAAVVMILNLIVFGFFIIHAAALAGMLRWRRYGKNIWLIMNLILTALIIRGTMMMRSFTKLVMSSGEAAEIQAMMFGLSAQSMIAVMHAVMILLYVFTAMSITWSIFNLVYYFRRRKLFAPFYAEPLEEPAPAENKVPDEKQTVNHETVQEPEKRAAKLIYCPYCGNDLKDEKTICPSCGRKLSAE